MTDPRPPKAPRPQNPDLRRLRASEIRDLAEKAGKNAVLAANALDLAAFDDLLARDRAKRPLVLHNELLTIINRCIIVELEVRRQKVWWRRLLRRLRVEIPWIDFDAWRDKV